MYTEFPLSEIEALHSRLEKGITLRMCLLEETASQVVLVLHTKGAQKLAPHIKQLAEERGARKELALKSIEVGVTNDMLVIGLRGNLVIRRVWGDLSSDTN